jgi:hypothetical protein
VRVGVRLLVDVFETVCEAVNVAVGVRGVPVRVKVFEGVYVLLGVGCQYRNEMSAESRFGNVHFLAVKMSTKTR